MSVAFRFAGDRGDVLQAALDAAEKQREKVLDSGQLAYGEGALDRTESPDFSKVGINAPFSQEVDEAPDYFGNYMARLDQFEQRDQYFS